MGEISGNPNPYRSSVEIRCCGDVGLAGWTRLGLGGMKSVGGLGGILGRSRGRGERGARSQIGVDAQL